MLLALQLFVQLIESCGYAVVAHAERVDAALPDELEDSVQLECAALVVAELAALHVLDGCLEFGAAFARASHWPHPWRSRAGVAARAGGVGSRLGGPRVRTPARWCTAPCSGRAGVRSRRARQSRGTPRRSPRALAPGREALRWRSRTLPSRGAK